MILIGMGANLPGPRGAPPATLAAAARALTSHGSNVTVASQLWRSAPVPVSDQPWYYNTVIRVVTTLKPAKLMAALKAAEEQFGRVRGAVNAARVLDLDLLAYDDLEIAEAGLTVPHPRLTERAFVLFPLQEVAPNWWHPQSGETVQEMIARLSPGQEIEPAGAWL